MDDFTFSFNDDSSTEDQQSSSVPSDKIKRVVCRHWVFNECHKGNACTYKHEWDLENMPECEYGDHCTRASCPLKHPPKSEDKECLFYKQGFCPHGKRCKYMHVRYEDGDLPVIVDVSCRERESEINPKDKTVFQTGIRRNKCRSYETMGECQYGENCVYSHETLDMRVAALDLCHNENDLKIPSYYNASYSYFFFSFPFLNQIADFVSNSEFMVPDCHIDAINQAFDKHNSHVYFFVSAQNSKIIHGLCEMRERACRDQEVSHRFQVKWLKVIHMPFMIFDQEDRKVKLETLKDGEIPDIGWELFVWVWRHPNVPLMMRQSVLEKPKKAIVDESLIKEDESITFEPSQEVKVPSYIASCSFIHGTSVLISMDRHEYDQFVSSDTLKLYQKDSALAHTIHIGTFIFLYDTSSHHIKGLYQAISQPMTFVGKNINNSPCIYIRTRKWYKFSSISLSSLHFSLHHNYRRVLTQKMMLDIMNSFFQKDKIVDYPNAIQLPSQVYTPCSFVFTMDIPYDEFKTGERIRKHPIYQRFTKSNGWGYIELLGKGSLDEKAIYVKSSSNTLSVQFYTCDGLRIVFYEKNKIVDNTMVRKEVESMIKEIKNEYEDWCREKELIPYPKEY